MFRDIKLLPAIALLVLLIPAGAASAQYTGTISGYTGPLPGLGGGFDFYTYPPGANLFNSAPVSFYSLFAPQDQSAFQPARSRRTNEAIDAALQSDGRLLIRWSGDPNTVDRIRFALLDSKRRVLSEKTITRLPAEAKLRPTNKTDAYRVVVEYLDGTTTSVVSPL